MRHRPLVLGVSALALCVAGCGSGGGDGSGADSGVTSFASDGSAPAAAWKFAGGEATASFTSGTAPPTTTVPAGGDVSAAVSLQFAAPATGGTLTLTTAENRCCGIATSDVTPDTLPPDGANTSGNPVLYLSFYNAGASTISLGSRTPAVTLTPTANGALAMVIGADDECQLDLYLVSNGAATWTAIPGASVLLAPNATSVAIPSAALPGGASLTFPPGQTLASISCD